MEEQTPSQNLTIEEMIKLGEKVDYWQMESDLTRVFNKLRMIRYTGKYRRITISVGESSHIVQDSCGKRDAKTYYTLCASISGLI